MKCMCGYEEQYKKHDLNDLEFYVANKSFYKTKLSVVINDKQGDWDCDRLSSKDVFICPECGTLKIDMEECDD